MSNERLETVEKLSGLVATEHRDHEAARGELMEVEAALLDKLVMTVKPALPALCSKLVKRERSYYVQPMQREAEIDYHEERGVILAGGREKRRLDQKRGLFEGEALALLRTGAWARLTYTGAWSQWEREDALEETTLACLDSRAVVAAWDVGEIISALEVALKGQAEGSRKKRTQEIRERVAAVAALVKLA